MEGHSKRFRVEAITGEIIKPSSPSPNPNHQGSFKLSLLDQFTHHIYVPTIFFYKATACSPAGGGRGEEVNESRSECLKSSLSKTLTRFYPFAGRLKDPLTISCNDYGVDYWEAHIVHCSLSDVLGKPNPKQLDLLFPEIDQSQDLTTRPLLLIQVSFFECGGMALGVKYNHKVADESSLCSFINCWADSALGNFNSDTPDFSASTILPPTDSLPPSASIPSIHSRPSVRTARFVFGPSELAAIQAKAASTNNPRPSRFEAVTTFVCKVEMLSQKESKPECKKPSVLSWAVNLRSKLQPPLPDNCFGNLVGRAVHEVGVDGTNKSSLASYIRRGTIDICQDFIRALKGDESYPRILELQMRKKNLSDKMFAGAIQLFLMTSWCKLPFYEADFGWGKPLWVTCSGSHPAPYQMVLVDTPDGNGIEVILSLTEEEMTRFESNQELKNCAAFNPSAFS